MAQEQDKQSTRVSASTLPDTPPDTQAHLTAPPPAHYATPNAARRAVDMALPLILQAMQDTRVGDSGFLYLVIMHPLSHPLHHDFKDSILYEHSVGDPQSWDADYGEFARAKALLHWRTGLNSHLVQERHPHLLQTGDTSLWGSACVDGIVVGASGTHPWFDEAFAGIVAYCFKAIGQSNARVAPHELFLSCPAKPSSTV